MKGDHTQTGLTMATSWDKLDAIMRPYSPRLRDELGLSPSASNQLATTIAAETATLPKDELSVMREQDRVGLQRRIEELKAFEGFMDLAVRVQSSTGALPQLTRAQVVYQLYTVFVYLGDACFKRLRKLAAQGSTLKACCKYLTDDRLRGMRNAVAHANWRYTDDFAGITFCYFRDQGETKETTYTVTQLELDFWDKLARVTAYAAFQTIHEKSAA